CIVYKVDDRTGIIRKLRTALITRLVEHGLPLPNEPFAANEWTAHITPKFGTDDLAELEPGYGSVDYVGIAVAFGDDWIVYPLMHGAAGAAARLVSATRSRLPVLLSEAVDQFAGNRRKYVEEQIT